MKRKLINLLKILLVNETELMINLEFDGFTFHTIELSDNVITLHSFINNFDYSIEYDNLDLNIKKIIFDHLNEMTYN